MLHTVDTASTLLAYVDPGSGAMLVQALIASVVGGFAWVSSKLFSRKKGSSSTDELENDDAADSPSQSADSQSPSSPK